MSFRDDRDGQDQGKPPKDAKIPSDAKPKPRTGERRVRKRAPGGEVGNALRTVYDDTLNESIPPEMLDLLGKLG